MMKNNSGDLSLIFMPIELFLTQSIFYFNNQRKHNNKSCQPNITVTYIASLLFEVFKKSQHNYLGVFHLSELNSLGTFSFVSELFILWFRSSLLRFALALLTVASLRVFRNPFISLRCCSLTPFNSSRTIILFYDFHARLNLIFFYCSAISLLPIFLLTHYNISYA